MPKTETESTTKYKEIVAGTRNGQDNQQSTENRSQDTQGSSEREQTSERDLSERTVTTQGDKTRVNIGATITFTVPFRVITPTNPVGGDC